MVTESNRETCLRYFSYYWLQIILKVPNSQYQNLELRRQEVRIFNLSISQYIFYSHHGQLCNTSTTDVRIKSICGQNPSFPVFAPGDSSTFGKNKLYPNTQGFLLLLSSLCPELHFSLCSSIHAHMQFEHHVESQSEPNLLAGPHLRFLAVTVSPTLRSTWQRLHASFSKQLYLPHCFLYHPMFMLVIRALLPP